MDVVMSAESTPHSSPEWFRSRRFSYEHISNQGTVKVSGDATGAVHGLLEQLEALRGAGEDVLLAWQGGRRPMTEAMSHLSAVLRGSNPARRPDG